MLRRILPLTLTALVAAPSAASAQGTASVSPNRVDTGTHFSIALDGEAPPVSGRVPRSIVLSAQRGFRFDARAVKVLCTPAQADQSQCPDASKIGSGKIIANVFGSDYEAPLELWLGKATSKAEQATVFGELNIMGSRARFRGRVVTATTGVFGPSVIFDDLPPIPLPPGVTITFKHFESEFGAQRTVRVKRRRHGKVRRVKVRRHLLRTPKTCPDTGTWAGQATLGFEDGTTAVIDAPIACTAPAMRR